MTTSEGHMSTMHFTPVDVTLRRRHSKTREVIFDTLRTFQRRPAVQHNDESEEKENNNVGRGKQHGRSRSFLPASMLRKQQQPLGEKNTLFSHGQLQNQPRNRASMTLDQVSDLVCSATDYDYRTNDRSDIPRSESMTTTRKDEINSLVLDSLYSQVILPNSVSSSARRPQSSASINSPLSLSNIAETTDRTRHNSDSANPSLIPPPVRSYRRRSVQIGTFTPTSMRRNPATTTPDRVSSISSRMLTTDSARTLYYPDAGCFDIVTAPRSPIYQQREAGSYFEIVTGNAEGCNGSENAYCPSISSPSEASSRHSKRKAIYIKGRSSSLICRADKEDADSSSLIVDLVDTFASTSISNRRRPQPSPTGILPLHSVEASLDQRHPNKRVIPRLLISRTTD